MFAVNLGYVDLGQVDLMVQEGFYSNRTDFIRTAIRNQLERHADDRE
jgi:Arc/MetJ-type ribon-helix-helix transcriptional regulator